MFVCLPLSFCNAISFCLIGERSRKMKRQQFRSSGRSELSPSKYRARPFLPFSSFDPPTDFLNATFPFFWTVCAKRLAKGRWVPITPAVSLSLWRWSLISKRFSYSSALQLSLRVILLNVTMATLNDHIFQVLLSGPLPPVHRRNGPHQTARKQVPTQGPPGQGYYLIN